MDDDDIAFFDAAQVRTLLDYPGCIAAVREAMQAFSAQPDEQPLRSILPLGPGKLFALMPGLSANRRGFGAKVISAFSDPDRPGRSAHRGVVVLFDMEFGTVRAVMDAGAITHIRTAAASAVATDVLAREDARTLAIFGCGAQAESHLRALALVRSFDQVVIWGRSVTAGQAFAERMHRESGLPIDYVADARDAAAAADVICTVTGASQPILSGTWLRSGTHVNLVGSSHAGVAEADADLVIASRFIVDSRRSALAAAAEYLNASTAGLANEAQIAGEIGEVLLQRIMGRQSADQITVYKSLGHIVQDLAGACYIIEKYRSLV